MKIPFTLGITFLFFSQLFSQTQPTTQKQMEDLAYPFPVKKVQLNKGPEIAYMDEGEGTHTLLMIHGLGSYAPSWNKNLAGLKDQYRCISLDLPNYGLSQKGDFPSTMSYFAAVLEDFIRTLELDKVILVGHSMGGQIAMHIVLNKKVTIEKLVLLAPAGFETFTEEEKQWFGQVVNPFVLAATPVEQIRNNFNLNFFGNALPEDALFMYNDRLALMEDSLNYNLYCNMIPKCVMGMLDEPVFERLPEITLPTLVLYGQEDVLIPNKFLHPDQTIDSVAKGGADRLANGRLELLSPCGHFIQWECADVVNQTISSFINQ